MRFNVKKSAVYDFLAVKLEFKGYVFLLKAGRLGRSPKLVKLVIAAIENAFY